MVIKWKGFLLIPIKNGEIGKMMKSRLVTRVKFNCRDSGKINICSTHIIRSILTMKSPVIGNKTYRHR